MGAHGRDNFSASSLSVTPKRMGGIWIADDNGVEGELVSEARLISIGGGIGSY